MHHIVFATFAGAPDLKPDDRLAAEALEARGARVSPAVWNGDQTPFETADAIVLRSTWDYWRHFPAFLKWFDRLEGRRHVYNPPALMRWNAPKRYLLELEAAGATLPPTRICAPDPESLRAAMAALDAPIAVAKPVISAGGDGLFIMRAGDAHSIERASAGVWGEAMVQPLIPEIRDPGETSFIFFGGAFSHAVIKRPTSDPILCQEEHGGVTVPADPPGWALDEARRILAMVEAAGHGAPYYARVDAIVLGDTQNTASNRVDGTFHLMEVELIEPTLFFAQDPAAPARFADGLMDRLN